MDRQTAEIVASLTLEGHADKAQEILAAEGVEITGAKSGRATSFDTSPEWDEYVRDSDGLTFTQEFNSGFDQKRRFAHGIYQIKPGANVYTDVEIWEFAHRRGKDAERAKVLFRTGFIIGNRFSSRFVVLTEKPTRLFPGVEQISDATENLPLIDRKVGLLIALEDD